MRCRHQHFRTCWY